MKKRICFLLPQPMLYPIGGYKVVYEYANQFVMAGWDVAICFSQYDLRKSRRVPLFHFFSAQVKRLLRFHKVKWFCLNPAIQTKIILCIRERYLPEADYYIATAIDTSYALAKISSVESSKKFYFIQGFENWQGRDEEYVYASYRLPLNKITVSKWLQQKIERTGERAVVIDNGFDFDYFKLTHPIYERDAYTAIMSYHDADCKRSVDVLSALHIVKQKIPQLKVKIFGHTARPKRLPEWMEYYQLPDRNLHNEIYNSSAVFVSASLQEGFGLPLGEAMMCGCAAACTDIGGFHALASHEKTALLSPVLDPESLAENIYRLMTDDELRFRLAENAHANIQLFTWKRAFDAFKKFLEDKDGMEEV